jgi:hypothetical protein
LFLTETSAVNEITQHNLLARAVPVANAAESTAAGDVQAPTASPKTCQPRQVAAGRLC